MDKILSKRMIKRMKLPKKVRRVMLGMELEAQMKEMAEDRAARKERRAAQEQEAADLITPSAKY